MTWCPFAERVDVALRDSQRRSMKPVGLVCHTAVSDSSNLRPTGTTRWHFYLNEQGRLFQYFDTEVPAAAQLDGNYWTVGGEGRGFISCESWDGAGRVWDGRNVNDCPPWNEAQLDTWTRLAAWLHHEHGIPLVKATGVRGTGIGYHSQFNTGDLVWTRTHACPAAARIRQMPALIARAQTTAQEEDMPITDADAQKIARAVHDRKVQYGSENLELHLAVGRGARALYRLEPVILDLASRVGVDPQAVAVALAPLLVDMLPTMLVDLSDEQVQRLATAINDDLARRVAS